WFSCLESIHWALSSSGPMHLLADRYPMIHFETNSSHYYLALPKKKHNEGRRSWLLWPKGDDVCSSVGFVVGNIFGGTKSPHYPHFSLNNGPILLISRIQSSLQFHESP